MKTLTDHMNEATSPIPMTEDRFWEIIKSMDWSNVSQQKEYDSEAIQDDLKKRLTVDEIVDLRTIYNIALRMLDKFIGEARNPAGGGDDSHGDLMSHIIGLGKHVFYVSLNDYALIEARGSAEYGSPLGYRECFAYLLPYPEMIDVISRSIDDSTEGEEYDVTINATIEKEISDTQRVIAKNKQEAKKIAHRLFMANYEIIRGDSVKSYDASVVSCVKVKA